jgi:uncharacterized protein
MRIDPQTIGFDIDGVLANTMQLFLDILLEVYGINHIGLNDITCYELEACLDIDPQIISTANQFIIDGGYPGRLAPLQGAARVLKRLGRYGPIRLVTARPYAGPIKPWIDGLLPPDRFEVEITTTGGFEAKVDILKAKDITCFVEDRLDTCFLLQERDITPVLFVQPWNRQPHPFQEVGDWAQLETLIDWGDKIETKGNGEE